MVPEVHANQLPNLGTEYGVKPCDHNSNASWGGGGRSVRETYLTPEPLPWGKYLLDKYLNCSLYRHTRRHCGGVGDCSWGPRLAQGLLGSRQAVHHHPRRSFRPFLNCCRFFADLSSGGRAFRFSVNLTVKKFFLTSCFDFGITSRFSSVDPSWNKLSKLMGQHKNKKIISNTCLAPGLWIFM